MKTISRIIVLLLAVGLGLTGCGGDDDSTVASDKTTTTAADSDTAAYCSAEVTVEGVGEPDIDFESASPDEITAASKSFAADKILPAALAVQKDVPEEDRANVDTLVDAVKKVAETGDFEGVFGKPEVDKASKADHAFALAECDWQRVDVTAVNYEFKGIPDTLKTGPTSFEFSNEGTELHEMVLIRKNDDTTESFDELLALPQDQAESKTTVVGTTFAAPGDEGKYAVADLEAGEYISLCFIPVGTVDENTHADGPPHFTKGMKREFTVS